MEKAQWRYEVIVDKGRINRGLKVGLHRAGEKTRLTEESWNYGWIGSMWSENIEDVKDQVSIGFALTEQGVTWVLYPGRPDDWEGRKDGNIEEQLGDDDGNPHMKHRAWMSLWY